MPLAHRGKKRCKFALANAASFGYPQLNVIQKSASPAHFQHLFKIANTQAVSHGKPFHTGVDIHWLYRDGDYGPALRLRFQNRQASVAAPTSIEATEHILVFERFPNRRERSR